MAKKKNSNEAKGRYSYDSELGGSLVTFLNKSVTPYPTDVSSPKFELVKVEEQKDLMLNVARMHAEQEYKRIMDLVAVLQGQAEEIKRRLYVTDAVHAAHYKFQLYPGQIYHLVWDNLKERTILEVMSAEDWSSGPPDNYEYLARVKWLGDFTWIEVDDKGNLKGSTIQTSGDSDQQSDSAQD